MPRPSRNPAEDQRERVGGRAERQRQQPRPQHLRGQRREARNADGDVHRRAPAARSRPGRPRPSAPTCAVMRDSIRRQSRDDRVERDGDVGRDGHVVHAQQVETGQQAADDGAADVAAVEVAEPGHAARRRLHPARDGGQRRAHQERRRQQADRRDDRAHGDVAAADPDVNAVDERHAEQQHQAHDADAELEDGVDLERMLLRVHVPRQQIAAEAHAAHERAEQHAERDRGRPDHQLQQLEPDDLVDQRRAAAADEQEQDERQVGEGRQGTWFPVGHKLGNGIKRKVPGLRVPRFRGSGFGVPRFEVLGSRFTTRRWNYDGRVPGVDGNPAFVEPPIVLAGRYRHCL